MCLGNENRRPSPKILKCEGIFLTCSSSWGTNGKEISEKRLTFNKEGIHCAIMTVGQNSAAIGDMAARSAQASGSTVPPCTTGERSIVLCFDGTESKFGPDPYTNLLKLFRLLDKDDSSSQICYYQPGIGASMTIQENSMWDWPAAANSAVDSAVAFTLDQHIMDAYRYLMRFYCSGDKIYLFGFRYV
jgi:uncharacterized protein (DUF2235 family)